MGLNELLSLHAFHYSKTKEDDYLVATYITRQKIINCLHISRMQPYLDAVAGNQDKALKLYQWNLDLTAATQSIIGITEVVLRNAMDRELQTWNVANGGSASWLLAEPETPLRALIAGKRNSALSRASKESIARVPSHRRFGAPVTHDDVLAQVMFGMWKDLLPNHAPNAGNSQENNNRERMWKDCLIHAFPNVQDADGSMTYWRVNHIHGLRNRVSHMEPLFQIDVLDVIRDSLRIIRSIDSDVANWVSGGNKVPTVLKNRPV
ncbi:hypothetical protein [Glutamicibacter sp. NPDC087344]|uniref:hypothetical protein n=1 Tax=Glutamicibacter sp. NPDC087344 TaxID=3363994 RepID=UPI00380BB66E